MQALLYVTNPDESAILRLVLQRVGFAAQITTELDQAVKDWEEQPAELIFLAFNRREIPIQLIRQLRAYSNAPMLVLSDALAEDTQVDLLEAGADLLVTRPYSARVLIAQTRALLRRSAGMTFYSLPSILQGTIELDPTLRLFKPPGREPVRLTQLEFRLLYTLFTHPEKPYPAEALVEHVWGYSGSGDRDLVRGLVRRLRAKIEPLPHQPRYLVTIPGVGYVFRIQTEPLNSTP